VTANEADKSGEMNMNVDSKSILKWATILGPVSKAFLKCCCASFFDTQTAKRWPVNSMRHVRT